MFSSFNKVLFPILLITFSLSCTKKDGVVITPLMPAVNTDGGVGGTTSGGDATKNIKYSLQNQTELEGSFSICTVVPVNAIIEPRLRSILATTNSYFPNGAYARTDVSFTGSNLTFKLTFHKSDTCSDPVLEFLGEGRFATGLQTTQPLKPLDAKIEKVYGTTWSSALATVLNQNNICGLNNWAAASSVNLTGLPCEGQLLYGFLKIGFTSYKLEDETRLFLGQSDLSHNPLSGASRPTELLPVPLIRSSAKVVHPVIEASGLEVFDQDFWVAEDNAIAESLAATYKAGSVLSFSVNTHPTHGILDLQTNGSFKYTPAENYIGSDIFEFKVTMGEVVKVAKANIKIDKVNLEPLDLTGMVKNIEKKIYEEINVPPKNLAVSSGTSYDTLTWDAVPDAISYNLYFRVPTGEKVTKSNSKISAVSSPYNTVTIPHGGRLHYAVSAVYTTGESDLSNGAFGNPIPSGFGVNPGQTFNYLYWNAASEATSYNIYWSTVAGVTKASNKINLSTTFYEHMGLVAGTRYYYAVSAVYSSGESELSAEEFEMIHSPPTNLAVESGTFDDTITWDAVPDAISYNLYFNWSTGETVTKAHTKISAVSSPYNAVTIALGARRHYAVSAVYNTTGESDLSNGAYGNPIPSSLSVTPGPGNNSLSWNLVSEATSYNIYWSTVAGVTKSSNKINLSTSSYAHLGLIGETRYYYAVSAVYSSGESSLSAEQSGLALPTFLAQSLDLSETRTCVRSEKGGIKCWGSNYGGQLGNGTTVAASIPQSVNLGSGRTAKAVATKHYHSCAILDDNSLKCWGYNSVGQLGVGTIVDASTPQSVDLGRGRTAKTAATNGGLSCAILDDNSLKCWGDNSSGQVGIGTTLNALTPQSVNLGSGRTAKAISLGDGDHSCAILDDNSLKCWGNNLVGQLGVGTTVATSTPQSVNLGSGRTAKAVAATNGFTCVILDDDSLKCWGSNLYGRLGIGGILGIGDGVYALTPQSVNLGSGRTAKALVLDYSTACAILDDNSLKCWGNSTYGQVGSGTSGIAQTPQSVNLGSGRTAKTVALRNGHTCAILDDDSLKCWGVTWYVTPVYANTPQSVDLGSGRTAKAVEVGWHHTCAILDDSSVKCWGRNYSGQLGIGTIVDALTPQPVNLSLP